MRFRYFIGSQYRSVMMNNVDQVFRRGKVLPSLILGLSQHGKDGMCM